MVLNFLDKYRDAGLLILRIGFGIMFAMHGAPKMFGGPEKWNAIGMAMGTYGINFLPVFWGFMAAFAEFGGAILLAFGLLFRPACMLMLFTMFIAASMHMAKGQGLDAASHAIEAGVVFLSLILIGPGKYSLDHMFALQPHKADLINS
jgi:putative oxidoreductase